MNDMQKTFYDYITVKAVDGKEDELKEFLLKNFKMQDEGTFTIDYLKSTAPVFLSLIKPEFIPELLENAKKMASTLE